ncbi:MAG TPA: ATP-binding cassette domain-containing protein [Streptosporangiaceae bacterium]|jgi:ribose transport system ATP-binding protein|nr:ATP-binding cassette domain-containing protein [Streptosporangiaceae bacterium]
MALTAQGVQALKLAGIWKSFDGVDALKGVTFEAQAGEIHALLGENGAGKSTLMAIAAGSLEPDRGLLELRGEPVEATSPLAVRQRGLSIAYQHPALVPDLTVLENLAMWLPGQAAAAGKATAAWASAALARVGCTAGLGQRVASLSVVQRQLLEVAKSLAADPSVLILDEPTASLGAEETEVLFAELRRLAESGVAVIYITHRLAEVRELCQQVTVLRDGAVRGTFPVTEITDAELLELIVGRVVTTEFPAKPAPVVDGTAPDGMGAAPLLHVAGLSGSGFHDVSLDVPAGEIVGLAGIVGNGQSDFLRALAGLGPAAGLGRGLLGRGGDDGAGVAELNGTRLRPGRPDAALRAGVVYLSPDRLSEGLFGTLSVRENALVSVLGQYSRGGVMNRRAEVRAVEAQRTSLGIKTESVDANVLSLSGGNQQKVLLARALLNDKAQLLLADEPTQGVDVGARTEIYRILRQAATDGAGVIVVSSDIRELAGLCDRVVVFSSGHMVAELRGDEVREDTIAHAMLTSTRRRKDDARRPAAGGRLGAVRERLAGLGRGDYGPSVVLALAVVGIALYTQLHNARFLSSFNISTLTVLIAALAFIALGQEFVILTGGIDLSVGPLAGLTVVIGSFFENDGKGPAEIIAGFLVMLAAALVIGLFNGSLVYYAKFTPIVATLVTYTALQGVSLVLRPFQDGYISFAIINGISDSAGPVAIAFVVAAVAAVVLERGLHRARWGRSVRAIGSDAAAAYRLGVRPAATVIGAYVACALFACLGGILLMSQVGVGDPTQGVNYTLASVTAVVLGGTSIYGGRGSFVGALFGAILVEQLLNVTTFLQLSQAWQYWFEGVLVMVAVGIYTQARVRSGRSPQTVMSGPTISMGSK